MARVTEPVPSKSSFAVKVAVQIFSVTSKLPPLSVPPLTARSLDGTKSLGISVNVRVTVDVLPIYP